jgi:hypothetical protein
VPRSVQLSTGETVTFKAHFSHRADMAFWEEALRRVDPSTKDLTNWVYWKCCEAILPLVIQDVSKGAQAIACTPEWLAELPVEDYEPLRREAAALREEMLAKVADGEKKAGPVADAA